MNIINLFAEIQANPQNTRAYRRLIDYYRQNNMLNEEQAFLTLLREQFGNHHTNIDSEQREDD